MNDKEVLDFYRAEIRHEFSLLGQRVSWYVACQSFLITAFAIANGAGRNDPWLAHALPWLGIGTSLLVLPGIVGAHRVINEWYHRELSFLSDDRRSATMSLVKLPRDSNGSPDWIHSMSLWFSSALPFAFVIFWIYVLLELPR